MHGSGAAVDGFLPSTSGFHFTNAFPRQPVLVFDPPGPLRVPIGDASRGLCGGMTYAVRDLFEAGRRPPDLDTPPPPDSPLYRYIVRRLFASWDLPYGVARYYRLMGTPGSDHPVRVATVRGTGMVTAADEWPRVRLDLHQGVLSPLGLVTEHTPNPLRLGHNHQVLAYAYAQEGSTVTLRVYDPNTAVADGDGVRLVFNLANPADGIPITHNVAVGGRPVRAFFRARYRRAVPPDF